MTFSDPFCEQLEQSFARMAKRLSDGVTMSLAARHSTSPGEMLNAEQREMPLEERTEREDEERTTEDVASPPPGRKMSLHTTHDHAVRATDGAVVGGLLTGDGAPLLPAGGPSPTLNGGSFSAETSPNPQDAEGEAKTEEKTASCPLCSRPPVGADGSDDHQDTMVSDRCSESRSRSASSASNWCCAGSASTEASTTGFDPVDHEVGSGDTITTSPASPPETTPPTSVRSEPRGPPTTGHAAAMRLRSSLAASVASLLSEITALVALHRAQLGVPRSSYEEFLEKFDPATLVYDVHRAKVAFFVARFLDNIYKQRDEVLDHALAQAPRRPRGPSPPQEQERNKTDVSVSRQRRPRIRSFGTQALSKKSYERNLSVVYPPDEIVFFQEGLAVEDKNFAQSSELLADWERALVSAANFGWTEQEPHRAYIGFKQPLGDEAVFVPPETRLTRIFSPKLGQRVHPPIVRTVVLHRRGQHDQPQPPVAPPKDEAQEVVENCHKHRARTKFPPRWQPNLTLDHELVLFADIADTSC